MPTQQELDGVYMGVALLHAKLSKARRKAVGACLVTTQGVCIPGYNGSATGLDNNLEDEVEGSTLPYPDNLVSKQEVIHGELNCILKAAKEGVSVQGSTMYLTLSPCLLCSAMMIQAGIKELVWLETYRIPEGLDLLQKAGVKCRHYGTLVHNP